MADEEVVALLTLNSKDFTLGLRSATQGLGTFETRGKQAFDRVGNEAKAMGDSVSRSLKNIDFRGAITEVSSFGREVLRAGQYIVDAADTQEKYIATLRQVTGSTEQAGKELKVFQDLAKDSSFSVDEIVKAGVRLRAKGIGLDKAIEQLKSAKDAAATLNEPLGDLTNFLQRARKGDAEALSVLNDRSVVSKDDLRKLGAAFDSGTGAIQAKTEEQRAALNEAINKGLQKFVGADAAAVESFSGQVSITADEVRKAASVIGAELIPKLKDLAKFVRDGAEAFQKLSPETKKTVANVVAVVGATSALAVGFSAVALPAASLVPLLFGVGKGLVAITRTGGAKALAAIATQAKAASVAVTGMTGAMAAQIAVAAAVAVAVGYLAKGYYDAGKAALEFEESTAALDKVEEKTAKAIGGFKNLGTTTAKELKAAGVTVEDLNKTIGSLQDELDRDAGGSDALTERGKEEIRAQTQRVRELRNELAALNKTQAESASGASVKPPGIDLSNVKDPFQETAAGKKALEEELALLDLQNATLDQRIAKYKELLASNVFLSKDIKARAGLQTKLNALVEKQANDAKAARVEQAGAAVDALDLQERAAQKALQSVQTRIAGTKEESAERKKLENDLFRLQEQANNARINALRGIIKEYQLEGSERKRLENEIFQLETANHQARLQRSEERRKAREKETEEAKQAAEAEEDAFEAAQLRTISLQKAAVDSRIAELEREAQAGKDVQLELEDAIRDRLDLEEKELQLRHQQAVEGQESLRVLAQEEQNLALETEQARDRAEDAIESHRKALERDADTATKAAQTVMQATQDVAKAQESIDPRKSLSEAFDPKQAVDSTAEFKKALQKAEAERQNQREKFKEANKDSISVRDTLDKEEQRLLRQREQEKLRPGRDKQRELFQKDLEAGRESLKSIRPELFKEVTRKLDTTFKPEEIRKVTESMVKPVTPDQVARATAAKPIPVNVKVEVTVQTPEGKEMKQTRPAVVTINGRNSTYKAAAAGMSRSSGGLGA